MLLVLLAGSEYGTFCFAFGTTPVTSGRSGSPSRWVTITSMPMRGMIWPPQPAPAQFCATRIQQVSEPSFLALRSTRLAKPNRLQSASGRQAA